MINAIIMASGLGTRMRPLTYSTPKPLIKIHGKAMIETVIEALSGRVDRIFVVVGYLKDKFEYLTQKYENLTLIENPDFETVNNISSIYYVRDILKTGSCYICEADLLVNNKEFLNQRMNQSGYFGKFVNGYSNDWVFETNECGEISRVGKCGQDCYNMVGFSYFLESAASLLSDFISAAYEEVGHENLFWDDVVNQNLTDLKLKIYPVVSDDIIEIDTIEELKNAEREDIYKL